MNSRRHILGRTGRGAAGSSRVAVFIGIVIIAAVVWLVVAYRWQADSRRNRRPNEVLGWGLAQETIQLMVEGGQVVVVAWAVSPLPSPPTAQEIQLREFERVLAERSHIHLQAVERIAPDQFDPAALQLRGVFPALLQKYPNADLFVSFVGVPDLDTEALEKAGHSVPKFLVVTTPSPALRTFIEKKLVTVAVVPRGGGVLVTAGDLESNAGQFQRQYQVITASNMVDVVSLPDNPARPQ